MRKTCGARSKRTGERCRRWIGLGHGGRCRYHGGTNPGGYHGGTTTAARAQWKKNLAIKHALGLKQPGGPLRGRPKTEQLVEKAKRQLEIALEGAYEAQRQGQEPRLPAQEIAKLPPTQLLAQASASELLSLTALEGMKRLYEIVSTPIDWMEPKQVRLIGDMALGTVRLALRAAEGEFRARRDDALTKLLEEIQRERSNIK